MADEEPVKPFNHMEALDKILKDVYQEQLDYQLKWQSRVLGSFGTNEPPKPTFKQKWNWFWDHIPDFIDYIKEYKFDDWRYWDRDGF